VLERVLAMCPTCVSLVQTRTYAESLMPELRRP
jgi:hypothetical protein